MDSTEEQLPWQNMTHEELERHYSPSRWSVRYSAGRIISEHVTFAENAALKNTHNLYCRLNVEYGEKSQQKMDIFGENLPAESPILVYVHGGYWQELNKNLSSYPAAAMYTHDVVTVVLGYSLAPKVRVEGIVEDIVSGIKTVCYLAEARGSTGVFLAGWSAGAHLICQALSTTLKESDLVRSWIKGVISFAGIFDLRPLVPTYVNEALFLTQNSSWELSPMKHVANMYKKLPLLLSFGESESPEFKRQSMQYSELLKKEAINVTVQEVANEDHFSLVERLYLADYSLTKSIVKFIDDNIGEAIS